MAKKKKTRKKTRRRLPRLVVPSRPRRPITLHEGTQYLAHAREYPLYKCWVGADWEERGITNVIVSRQLPNGKVLAGFYLVDLYCLGVKDTFVRVFSSQRSLERNLQKFGQHHEGGIVECTPAFAHEMIYGAVEYAAQYDLHPHKDFEESQLLLDPPDAHPRSGEISFGEDGKPFYIAGPNDSPMFVQSIISTLQRTAGVDNFHFLIPISPDDEFIRMEPDEE